MFIFLQFFNDRDEIEMEQNPKIVQLDYADSSIM